MYPYLHWNFWMVGKLWSQYFDDILFSLLFRASFVSLFLFPSASLASVHHTTPYGDFKLKSIAMHHRINNI